MASPRTSRIDRPGARAEGAGSRAKVGGAGAPITHPAVGHSAAADIPKEFRDHQVGIRDLKMDKSYLSFGMTTFI